MTVPGRTALYVSLLTASGAAAALVLFPPVWRAVLLEESFFGVPYLLLTAGILISVILLSGLLIHSQWKHYRTFLDEKTEQALQMQLEPPSAKDEEHLRKLYELQEKTIRQTQRLRQITTEKAAEREKSLHEVVLQERTRLARELHDSVSQQLFAASMLTAAINETETDNRAREQFQLVEKMINQSQLEMRALLLHLRPAALKGKSLKEGMEELLGELQQKVPVSVESRLEEVELDKGVEDHLFRILQEAVSNSLRHAEAEEMKVVLLSRDGKVILQVSDNGRGFIVEEEAPGSYGMTTMKERAEEVGGTFKIVSVPGEGTRVEVQIPV
jgi:two-component system, NarL family, sensor histidine kinase LiaS